MKVFTNNKFEGFYPVGTAAVVVADSAIQAAQLLNEQLVSLGLSPTATADQFSRLPTSKPAAVVLHDGDY